MSDSIYDELLKKLENDPWPAMYMFKFIVPSDNHKIALVERLFDDGAEINHQPSSGGKYTSITIRQVMLSATAVIEVYRQASTIEGIISL